LFPGKVHIAEYNVREYVEVIRVALWRVGLMYRAIGKGESSAVHFEVLGTLEGLGGRRVPRSSDGLLNLDAVAS
jgi:hypothetical protein